MGKRGDSAAGSRSRRKGVGAERALARRFAEWWKGQVQRTPMSGAYDPEWRLAGDLMFVDPWPFEVEIRNRENWHLEQLFETPQVGPIPKWLEEIDGRAHMSHLRPMLIVRRNFVPALLCIRIDDLNSMRWQRGRADIVCVPHPKWVIMALETFFVRVTPEQVKSLIPLTPGAQRAVPAPDRPLDYA